MGEGYAVYLRRLRESLLRAGRGGALIDARFFSETSWEVCTKDALWYCYHFVHGKGKLASYGALREIMNHHEHSSNVPVAGHIFLLESSMHPSLARARLPGLPSNVAIVAGWGTRNRVMPSEVDENMQDLLALATGQDPPRWRDALVSPESRDSVRSPIGLGRPPVTSVASNTRTLRRDTTVDGYRLVRRLGRGGVC